MSVVPPVRGEPVVIRSGAELALLRAGRLPIRRRGLRLELPGLEEGEAARIAERIVAFKGECGCEIGGWFAYPVVAAALAWGVIDPPATGVPLLQRLALSLGGVLIAAVIGKGIGVTRALGGMRREIDQLASRLEENSTVLDTLSE